jgi:hypothetical protein
MIYLKRTDFKDRLTNGLGSTYCLRAFDLWWLMRIIHIDHKGKDESAPFVHSYMREILRERHGDDSHEHAFIGSDGECEVEEVGRVGEIGDHSRGKVKLSQIL